MDAAAEGSAGVVLIADDDLQVRTIMVRMLERIGFEALAAATDAETLEVFREHAARIDVAILDVGLEEGGGPAALEQMLAITSGFGILLTSGDPPNPELAQRIESWGAQFLAKPFRAAELREAVVNLVAVRSS